MRIWGWSREPTSKCQVCHALGKWGDQKTPQDLLAGSAQRLGTVFLGLGLAGQPCSEVGDSILRVTPKVVLWPPCRLVFTGHFFARWLVWLIKYLGGSREGAQWLRALSALQRT